MVWRFLPAEKTAAPIATESVMRSTATARPAIKASSSDSASIASDTVEASFPARFTIAAVEPSRDAPASATVVAPLRTVTGSATNQPSGDARASVTQTSSQEVSLKEKLARLRIDFAQRSRQAARDAQTRTALSAQRRLELQNLAAEGESATDKDHRTLANIYTDLMQWDRVSEHAAQALREGPAEESLCVQQITAFVWLRDFAAAERALAAAKQQFPDSPSLSAQDLRIDQGQISDLLRSERIGEAEQALEASRQKLAALRAEFPSQMAQWDGMQRSLDGLDGSLKTIRRRLELIGKPASPLTADTWLNTPRLSMDGLRGKVVLLDFWAVWCGPCIATFPHLRHWHDEFSGKGLVIIGVTRYCQFDWDEGAKRSSHTDGLSHEQEDLALQAFLRHHDLKHAVAVTSGSELSARYLVSGIPQVVVIDRQGKIRMIRVGSGQKNAEDLEYCLRDCLGEKSPAYSPKR